MLGLVLWCDAAARRALIWCEDHGDLALYEAGGGDADMLVQIRAGDLVHVGISATQGLRRARSLRIVAQGVQPDLPLRLSREAAG